MTAQPLAAVDQKDRRKLGKIVGDDHVNLVLSAGDQIVRDYETGGLATADPARRIAAAASLAAAASQVARLLQDPALRWHFEVPMRRLYGGVRISQAAIEAERARLDAMKADLESVAARAGALASGRWHKGANARQRFCTTHMVEMLHFQYGVPLSTSGPMQSAIDILWRVNDVSQGSCREALKAVLRPLLRGRGVERIPSSKGKAGGKQA